MLRGSLRSVNHSGAEGAEPQPKPHRFAAGRRTVLVDENEAEAQRTLRLELPQALAASTGRLLAVAKPSLRLPRPVVLDENVEILLRGVHLEHLFETVIVLKGQCIAGFPARSVLDGFCDEREATCGSIVR